MLQDPFLYYLWHLPLVDMDYLVEQEKWFVV
jgi:hypothetical protein